MKSTLVITIFDAELLSIIRQKIIDAISGVNVTLNKEYRLSQVNSGKASFNLEIIDPKDEATPRNVKLIKKSLTKEFGKRIDIKDSGAFINVNATELYLDMVIG